MAKNTCSVEGCGKMSYVRGWCTKHYARWRRYGDPLALFKRPGFPDNLIARMEPLANGCIWFTGALNAHGYGMVWRDGEMVLAHRAAYEHFVGPIPEGMTIDHECHNADETCPGGITCQHRRCVNVEHMVPKTATENALASPHAPANRTHCPQGHPYSEENLYVYPDGAARSCRTCKRAVDAQYRLRQRLVKNGL